ncbi:MAG: hypothetical protein AABX33_08125 [Nanoarchaeota archaeon]
MKPQGNMGKPQGNMGVVTWYQVITNPPKNEYRGNRTSPTQEPPTEWAYGTVHGRATRWGSRDYVVRPVGGGKDVTLEGSEDKLFIIGETVKFADVERIKGDRPNVARIYEVALIQQGDLEDRYPRTQKTFSPWTDADLRGTRDSAKLRMIPEELEITPDDLELTAEKVRDALAGVDTIPAKALLYHDPRLKLNLSDGALALVSREQNLAQLISFLEEEWHPDRRLGFYKGSKSYISGISQLSGVVLYTALPRRINAEELRKQGIATIGIEGIIDSTFFRNIHFETLRILTDNSVLL